MTDPPDRGESDPFGTDDDGLFTGLRRLIMALRNADRDGRSGRRPMMRVETSYSLLDGIKSEDTDEAVSDEEPLHRTDVRYDHDTGELMVVADLPNVAKDDLSVGFDKERNQLVMIIDGREADRIDLPWSVTEIESRFHHGVLELRMRPEVGNDEQ